MENDIKDYLSKEEQEHMDILIQRAKQRKERRKAAANGEMRFQYFQCQCGCTGEQEDEAENEREWQETSRELERLLSEICQFCLKYGLCQCPDYREKREKKRKEAETLFDEDLPF